MWYMCHSRPRPVNQLQSGNEPYIKPLHSLFSGFRTPVVTIPSFFKLWHGQPVCISQGSGWLHLGRADMYCMDSIFSLTPFLTDVFN